MCLPQDNPMGPVCTFLPPALSLFFFFVFLGPSSDVAWAGLNLRSSSLGPPSAGTTDSEALCF